MGTSISASAVLGVILAGGQARRMGGIDKGTMELGGRPFIGHVVDRFRPQVGEIIVSANGDPERFASLGLPVIPDGIEGFSGPLAGILAAMNWAHDNMPKAEFIATAAVDTPFFPDDLVDRLSAALDDQFDIAVAQSNARIHPVFGLFRLRLAEDLSRFLADPGSRAVIEWVEHNRSVIVPFQTPAKAAIDPFFNINRPDDVLTAERLLQSGILRRPPQ